MTQPAALPLVHTSDVPLRWRDLDSYHHVNNASFATLIEEARVRWFASLPGPWRAANAEPLVARLELDYLSPMQYPGTARIELRLERLGNSSLHLLHEVRNALQPEQIFARGKTVLVWVDPSVGKSTPIPEFIRSSLQALCQ